MKRQEFNKILNKIDKQKFISNAHINQHRLFGYITTNIRSPKTIAYYVDELVPEYLKRKNNPNEWEEYVQKPEILKKDKQKFKRLEIAKILFRKTKDSPYINRMGERLYKIHKENNTYLIFILSLYLLTGRYYSVDNQPLVEIEKILSSYNGNILKDGIKTLLNNNIDRLLLACILYNPDTPEAINIAYGLIENDKDYCNHIKILEDLLQTKDSFIYKRVKNAGGHKNFKYDIATILNYYLFKITATEHFKNGNENYQHFISKYIDNIFEHNLNKFYGIKQNDKGILKKILQDKDNTNILKDVLELAVGIKISTNSKQKRKNIKQEIIEKYDYQCFYHCHAKNEQERNIHIVSYFQTKKNQTYLEAHHMIQLGNSKLFKHDIDIVENLIPVCPNCHRKLHNASNEIVIKMLKIYYDNIDKINLIKKGIFVDINTLASFYGIEEV